MTIRYRFSGHETFPFRFLWPQKGIRGIIDDPSLFFREDAIVRLGVGKNMVSSIRFWCQALGLAEADGRRRTAEPTELGQKLFGKHGWDPYLEDPGTLWLLHWELIDSPGIASTWSLAFTGWRRNAFTRSELVEWLAVIAKERANQHTSRNSLRRDVEVFIRTYVPTDTRSRRAIEDSFDCPLSELGLLRREDRDLYRFNRGVKPNLPIEILGLCSHPRYWDREASGQETLTFDRVLYGRGSIGSAFQLSDVGLASHLEALPAWTGFDYDETGGLRLLIRRERAKSRHPIRLLERYYASQADRETTTEVAA